MKPLKILFAILFVLSLTACKKHIKENPEFVGYWTAYQGGTSYSLDITDKGRATYEEVGFGELTASGRFRLKDGNILKINLLFSLEIDQFPRDADSAGLRTMTLDGVDYYTND